MSLLIPADPVIRRGNNFDALRIGMALLVVWSHSFALWYRTEAGEPLSRLLGNHFTAGNVAVLSFFSISGFLVSRSYAQTRDPVAYLRKRLARIYPGWIVCIAVCLFVIWPLFSSVSFSDLEPAQWRRLAGNFFFRDWTPEADRFDNRIVNGSLWTICHEWWCYVFVLVFAIANGARFRWALLALAVVLMAARALMDRIGFTPGGGLFQAVFGWQYAWFFVLPSFLFGMAAFHFRESVPRDWRILALLVAATLAAAHLPGGIAKPLTTLLLPPTVAYAVFHFAFSTRIDLRHAGRYGDFSYGTYLYGYPVQQMLLVGLHGRTPFLVYAGCCLLMSLCAGVASWYVVERWSLGRRANRSAEPSTSSSVPPAIAVRK